MRMMKKVLLRISLMMVQKNQQPVKKVHQIATVMLQSRVILKLIGEKQEPIPEMVSHKKRAILRILFLPPHILSL